MRKKNSTAALRLSTTFIAVMACLSSYSGRAHAQAANGVVPAQGSAVSVELVGGVPVVNISAPNARGVSNNRFDAYNVPTQGLVINNSRQATTTSLAGAVGANAALVSGGAASVILNQVVSTQKTEIAGSQEIAGTRASLIVANPNGIQVSGSSRTINASDLTLLVGRSAFDTQGNLAAFSTENTTSDAVLLIGAGLEADNAVTLVAPRIRVENGGSVTAQGANSLVNVVALDGMVARSNSQVLRQTSGATAVDASLLGVMTAGRIRVAVHGENAGVNISGRSNAATTFVALTDKSDLRLTGDVNVSGTGGGVAISSGKALIATNAKITAPTAITVNAADSIDVNDTELKGTSNAANVSLVSTNGNIRGRALSIDTQAQSVLSAQKDGASIQIDSSSQKTGANAFLFADSVNVVGSTIESGAGVFVSKGIDQTTGLNAPTKQDIVLDRTNIRAVGDVELISGRDIRTSGTINAGTTVTAEAAGLATIGAAVTANALSVAGESVNIENVVNTKSSVDLTAFGANTGDIRIQGAATGSVIGGDLRLLAPDSISVDVPMRVGGTVFIAEDIMVNQQGQITALVSNNKTDIKNLTAANLLAQSDTFSDQGGRYTGNYSVVASTKSDLRNVEVAESATILTNNGVNNALSNVKAKSLTIQNVDSATATKERITIDGKTKLNVQDSLNLRADRVELSNANLDLKSLSLTGDNGLSVRDSKIKTQGGAQLATTGTSSVLSVIGGEIQVVDGDRVTNLNDCVASATAKCVVLQAGGSLNINGQSRLQWENGWFSEHNAAAKINAPLVYMNASKALGLTNVDVSAKDLIVLGDSINVDAIVPWVSRNTPNVGGSWSYIDQAKVFQSNLDVKHDLSFAANKDVRLAAANAKVGGDMQIQTNNNVVFDSHHERNYRANWSNGGRNFSQTESRRDIGANVQVQGSLLIDDAQKVELKASTVNAKGNSVYRAKDGGIALTAGYLVSGTNSTTFRNTGGNFTHAESISEQHRTSPAASAATSSSNLSMLTTGAISSTSSVIGATGVLTLSAAKGIKLGAQKATFESRELKTGVFSSDNQTSQPTPFSYLFESNLVWVNSDVKFKESEDVGSQLFGGAIDIITPEKFEAKASRIETGPGGLNVLAVKGIEFSAGKVEREVSVASSSRRLTPDFSFGIAKAGLGITYAEGSANENGKIAQETGNRINSGGNIVMVSSDGTVADAGGNIKAAGDIAIRAKSFEQRALLTTRDITKSNSGNSLRLGVEVDMGIADIVQGFYNAYTTMQGPHEPGDVLIPPLPQAIVDGKASHLPRTTISLSATVESTTGAIDEKRTEFTGGSIEGRSVYIEATEGNVSLTASNIKAAVNGTNDSIPSLGLAGVNTGDVHLIAAGDVELRAAYNKLSVKEVKNITTVGVKTSVSVGLTDEFQPTLANVGFGVTYRNVALKEEREQITAVTGKVNADESIIIKAGVVPPGETGAERTGSVLIQGAALDAGKNIEVNAVQDIKIEAARSAFKSNGERKIDDFSAGITVTPTPLTVGLNFGVKQSGASRSTSEESYKQATFQAGGDVTLDSSNASISMQAPVVNAAGNVSIDAKKDVTLEAVYDTKTSSESESSAEIRAGITVAIQPQVALNGFNIYGKAASSSQSNTSAIAKVGAIDSNASVSINSQSGNVALTAPSIKAGKDIIINAEQGAIKVNEAYSTSSQDANQSLIRGNLAVSLSGKELDFGFQFKDMKSNVAAAKATVGNLNASDDVVLKAGSGVDLTGTKISAANVSVDAGNGGINLKSAVDTSSADGYTNAIRFDVLGLSWAQPTSTSFTIPGVAFGFEVARKDANTITHTPVTINASKNVSLKAGAAVVAEGTKVTAPTMTIEASELVKKDVVNVNADKDFSIKFGFSTPRIAIQDSKPDVTHGFVLPELMFGFRNVNSNNINTIPVDFNVGDLTINIK
jgi:filamentous hemagglutinin family protein